MLSDTTTPVNIYLKLRDRFPGAFLLESSDYHGNENSFSYICFKPVANFRYFKSKITETVFEQDECSYDVKNKAEVLDALKLFSSNFTIEKDGKTDFIPGGIFGYITFDAVTCFEEIEFTNVQSEIPDVSYSFFQFIIAINHFKTNCIWLSCCRKVRSQIFNPYYLF